MQPASGESESRVISPMEGWEILDRAAWKYLGISGGMFMARWDAGVYRRLGTEESVEVRRVSMFLNLGRIYLAQETPVQFVDRLASEPTVDAVLKAWAS